MTIQFCSDLHLEFLNHRAWFQKHPLVPTAEILVIAGDTYYLNKDYAQLDFIQQVAKDFKMVYLIPGNHEYYNGYDIATALEPSRIEIMKNVVLLNNTAVELNGVKLIFSTLWSKIEKKVLEVFHGMNDFRQINFNGEPFQVHHFNDLHERAFAFLVKEIEEKGPKMVVTHHLPSRYCNVPAFQNSTLNEAFCVDKTNFIANSDINYWIYGHSHRNKEDFELEGTQLVTNQLGYLGYGEHQSFDYSKTIEI